MDLYIGIDLGTSSVKLLLVDGNGVIKNTVTKEYAVFYPRAGWCEQNASDWWGAICAAISELLCGFDGPNVKGIGVAGQMHGLVVLDENDKVIRPTILWNDGRTSKETAYLNEEIGKGKLFEYTGNIAFAGFTAPKIMWLRENEPESFAKISKIMLPKDYINYLLTGTHCTDFSDAAGMLLLDVKNKAWSGEMLDICGIDESVLPKLYNSFEVVGRIKAELAEKFGINPDAVVVAGAGDNAAAAIGTGTVGDGCCNISLGTSGTIFVSSNRFSGDEKQAIHSFCHADGGYHLMGCILSAASCNKWFCDEVLGTKDYKSEEMGVPKEKLGKNEVFFLPYLMGERSPINDTDATGIFIGLRPNTTHADMYQAVLEGVAFAIKDNLEVIKQLGIDIKSSCLCGGGAKSRLWIEILANALNIELNIPVTEQGPGYGSAILAMIGAGKFESVKQATDKFFKIKETVRPHEELVRLYANRYEKYRKIYPAVKELYKEIKE
ncbi:MAG: xylulokinase [Ruminococcaceae bacterium]|nr:xylulokinase [Oscillospiraceae bacterium]